MADLAAAATGNGNGNGNVSLSMRRQPMHAVPGPGMKNAIRVSVGENHVTQCSGAADTFGSDRSSTLDGLSNYVVFVVWGESGGRGRQVGYVMAKGWEKDFEPQYPCHCSKGKFEVWT